MTQADESLATEVAALRDLFQRRLMEDRDKRQLYQQLADLVALTRSDLERQFVTPIARELVMVLDGIDESRRASTDPQELVDSVRDEIMGILSRRLIEPFAACSQPFDPARHEAVAQMDYGPDNAGLVVEERRTGWSFGTGLLRAARVVVGSEQTADSVSLVGGDGYAEGNV